MQKVAVIQIPYPERGSFFSDILPAARVIFPPSLVAELNSLLLLQGFDVFVHDFSLLHHGRAIRCFKDNDLLRYIQGNGAFEVELKLKKFLFSLKELVDIDGMCLLIPDARGLTHVLFALALARFLHQQRPSMRIILAGGGLYKKEMPDNLLQKCVDQYSIVEAILTSPFCADTVCRLLIKKPSGDSNQLFDGVIGYGKVLAWSRKRGGRVVSPNYAGLNMAHYGVGVHAFWGKCRKNELVIKYAWASGCSKGCAYCAHAACKQPFYRDVADIIADLKRLTHVHACRAFVFDNDLCLNDRTEMLDELCRAFISFKKPFHFIAALDLRSMDQNDLKHLRAAGCVGIVVGLESADELILQRCDRLTNIKHVAEMIRYAKKLGLFVKLNVMIGLPYECEKAWKNTVEFVLSQRGALHSVRLSSFALLEGSPMFMNPSQYKIANVRLMKEPSLRKIFRHRWYAFDETDGLLWSEKQKEVSQRMCVTSRLFWMRGLLNTHWFYADAFLDRARKFYQECG